MLRPSNSTRAARLVIALAIFVTPIRALAKPTLVINRAWSWPISSPDGSGLFDRVVKEAMARVGVDVELQQLSAERSLANANRGLDDGDGPRIEGIDRIYPNLVRVPEQIVEYDFVAFTNQVDPEIRGFASLEPYHVGIVRGWKILERGLAGAASLTTVRTPRLLMTLLAKQRVQVVVFERTMGVAMAQDIGLDEVRVLEPPLVTRPMFLYLNLEHAALVPKVAAALREMKADGTYDRIVREVRDAGPGPSREAHP